MTKKVVTLILLIVLFSTFAGCQDANKHGDEQFPKSLAGTWKPDESRWIFTFEPNGRISEFRHHGGMEFDVAEGGLVEKWRNNIDAIFALGPCQAQYNRETRELSVTIVIQHYIIDFPKGPMEGNFHDYLTGPISQDGTTWNVAWTSTGEILGSGSSKVGPKQLTFTKVMNDSKKD